MKKLCIVTGTRAEYGLFYPLLKLIKDSKEFELQIIATGMHLSPEFGLTYREIEEDGFKIDEKIEMLLSSDSDIGISKSIGLGVIGFSDSLKRLNPDMVVLLGDRFETFSAAIASYVLKIPISHLYGGEITEGAIDEGLRHSITKMSMYHFTSIEKYRMRVIQLGEDPERVFNVGALGIDNIKNEKLLSKRELEDALGFKLDKKTILVTYHSETLSKNRTSEKGFLEIKKVIDELKDYKFIITMPNADNDSRAIVELIKSLKNDNRIKTYTSLGRKRYLSLLQYVRMVMGNSSSGIIEAPSFKIPTINIGDRQKGRIKPRSVIDCKPTKDEIIKAVKKAEMMDLQDLVNPYGDGKASQRILGTIKEIFSKGKIEIKKEFYDVDFKLVNRTQCSD
jgi:GDP/UDP-N,N'-diacetylbacillosamine 2-epimerase (hydrolysing)